MKLKAKGRNPTTAPKKSKKKMSETSFFINCILLRYMQVLVLDASLQYYGCISRYSCWKMLHVHCWFR